LEEFQARTDIYIFIIITIKKNILNSFKYPYLNEIFCDEDYNRYRVIEEVV